MLKKEGTLFPRLGYRYKFDEKNLLEFWGNYYLEIKSK